MRLLAGRGDEALGELMSLGFEPVRRHHRDILEYIQESHPKERWTAALSTGWQHDDAFVLPDEIITPPGSDYRSGTVDETRSRLIAEPARSGSGKPASPRLPPATQI